MEDVEQDIRDNHEAGDIADDAADERGGNRIDEVLGKHARFGVAKRLVQANEHTLFLDHTRGGGEAHKDGDHEEDDRDDAGNGLDGGGI